MTADTDVGRRGRLLRAVPDGYVPPSADLVADRVGPAVPDSTGAVDKIREFVQAAQPHAARAKQLGVKAGTLVGNGQVWNLHPPAPKVLVGWYLHHHSSAVTVYGLLFAVPVCTALYVLAALVVKPSWWLSLLILGAIVWSVW